MTDSSTTIRVSRAQRERLRDLARQRSTSMTETLDAALESLRRDEFYRGMAGAEQALRGQPDAWTQFVAERDEWLSAELG